MTIDKLSLVLDENLSCYISSGCNRTSNCVDWGANGYVCYGACNSIAIAEYTNGICRILTTINKHKGRVNSVKWIRSPKNFRETELVSCSTDNTVIVWRFVQGEIHPVSIMTSHTLPVNIVEGLYANEVTEQGYPDTYITSTSADSTVKLWLRKQAQNDFICISSISLGNGLCLSLSLTIVPEASQILLALGMDDCKINLYSDEGKLQTLVGHEDWIKSLHFTYNGNDIMLASGSQDTTIRLWKICKRITSKKIPTNEFKLDEQIFKFNGIEYVVSLESLLMGHEGWVCGLQWKPNSDGKQLVSCSIDRTVLLWEVDKTTGVWLETSRLGELGGNTLGYLTITFSPDTLTLLGNSHQGALHMWRIQNDGVWKSVGCFGGHFEGVVDISWENLNGRYLLSCSLDKTTRLHAPYTKHIYKQNGWYELSRPQIHGHAMSGLISLPNFSLASASEEKVVRVFTAPDNVIQNLTNLTHTFTDNDRQKGGVPLGAAVPSLGLSNKAVFQGESMEKTDSRHPNDEFSDGYFTPQYLTEPPTEDNLAQNTLWPEVMKLYGHGFEVYTLTATYAGDILATACKASSALHARIILWDSTSWDQIMELEGHNLTVTQMEFSPDDCKLISVSRDRTWCLYIRQSESNEFKLLYRSDKQINPHSRIIWCCTWSFDGLYYATGSRDGKIAIWPGESLHIATRPPASAPLTVQQSVTSVAFTKKHMLCIPPNSYLLAIGLENGIIQTYIWQPTSWTFLFTVPANLGHHLTVNKLSFRPMLGKAEDKVEESDQNVVQLASCSLDHSVRVFTINVKHWISQVNTEIK